MLTVILGNIDMALQRLGDGQPRVQRLLDAARQGSERAATLVQRMLAFSRQHPQEVKAVDLNRMVQSMSELLRRTIGETITIDGGTASSVQSSTTVPAVRSRMDSLNQLELSTYATIQLRDELARLPGVGDITYLGQRDYSIRAWLDPQKMASRNVTAKEVSDAVKDQNVAISFGQIGQQPTPEGQQMQLTLDALGRLTTPEQFGEIVVGSTKAKYLVRLRDVARIEKAAENTRSEVRINNRLSIGIAILKQSKSNTLEVATGVRTELATLRPTLPPRMRFSSTDSEGNRRRPSGTSAMPCSS